MFLVYLIFRLISIFMDNNASAIARDYWTIYTLKYIYLLIHFTFIINSAIIIDFGDGQGA